MKMTDVKITDLNTPAVIRNPYPAYEALRPLGPQFGLKDYPPGTIPGVDQPMPAWVCLTYQDVVEVASRPDVFSSRDIMQEASSAPTLMLVNHDKPEHTFLRNLSQKAFTPKRIEKDVAPWAEQTVKEMMDKYGDGEVDVMQTFAVEMPAKFITRLIGTPLEDWDKLRHWGNAFMVSSDFTAEERQKSNIELVQYYSDAVDERVKDINKGIEPPDDIMTALIVSEHDGRTLSLEEVKRFCMTLVVAGAETTVYLLGNLVANFLERPDLYSALRADRSLVRPYMEETLRRDGPPQRLFRVAMQDYELSGAKIKAGDWVAVFFAAANRDPDEFPEPDQLILNRANIKRHLTFGHGIHHCMGARTARMEADKLLNGLLDRYSRIEPASAPLQRQQGGLLNYGLDACPVNLVKG